MTQLTIKWASEVLAAFAPPSELSPPRSAGEGLRRDPPRSAGEDPQPTGLAPLAGEVDYAGVFVALLRGSTRLASLGLRLAVWLVALAPAWHWRKPATLSGLPVGERARLLGELLRHRWFAVRELTLLLKLGASLALLGAASVRQRSGYDHVQPRAKLESGLQRRLPLAERSAS